MADVCGVGLSCREKVNREETGHLFSVMGLNETGSKQTEVFLHAVCIQEIKLPVPAFCACWTHTGSKI